MMFYIVYIYIIMLYAYMNYYTIFFEDALALKKGMLD